jgi:hypothetical protein
LCEFSSLWDNCNEWWKIDIRWDDKLCTLSRACLFVYITAHIVLPMVLGTGLAFKGFYGEWSETNTTHVHTIQTLACYETLRHDKFTYFQLYDSIYFLMMTEILCECQTTCLFIYLGFTALQHSIGYIAPECVCVCVCVLVECMVVCVYECWREKEGEKGYVYMIVVFCGVLPHCTVQQWGYSIIPLAHRGCMITISGLRVNSIFNPLGFFYCLPLCH